MIPSDTEARPEDFWEDWLAGQKDVILKLAEKESLADPVLTCERCGLQFLDLALETYFTEGWEVPPNNAFGNPYPESGPVLCRECEQEDEEDQ